MNASFETTTNYNCLQGSFINYSTSFPGYGAHMLDNWQPIASPDYFNGICTSGGYKVPTNTFGVLYPINGNAYVGLIAYSKPYEIKEYIQQHLNAPLISGKTYYTSFYVSLSDRFTMAIKNVGAYFSVAQPTVVSVPYISATPQIQNHSGFLSDTAGWTKIEGYFVAQGGEEYITIGNFNSNANTDTLYTGSNDPAPGNPDGAYYYIDSVSLYDSLDYAIITNIENTRSKLLSFTIYPNPAKDKVRVIINASTPLSMTNIKITDVVGREVKELEYDASIASTGSATDTRDTTEIAGKEIDISDLERGVYFLSLIEENKTLGVKKIIKE